VPGTALRLIFSWKRGAVCQTQNGQLPILICRHIGDKPLRTLLECGEKSAMLQGRFLYHFDLGFVDLRSLVPKKSENSKEIQGECFDGQRDGVTNVTRRPIQANARMALIVKNLIN
jgi:hypothetical protein